MVDVVEFKRATAYWETTLHQNNNSIVGRKFNIQSEDILPHARCFRPNYTWSHIVSECTPRAKYFLTIFFWWRLTTGIFLIGSSKISFKKFALQITAAYLHYSYLKVLGIGKIAPVYCLPKSNYWLITILLWVLIKTIWTNKIIIIKMI